MVQRFYISISPQLYVFAAILLLIVPLPWLCGWVVAVLTHELSHCLALYLCGKQIDMVFLSINGARIQTEHLSDLEAIVCSLAGPVGGLLLLITANIFPEGALCAVALSLYNLLPVFPLDGGRALRALAHLTLPENICETLCFMTEKLVLLGIILLCVLVTFVWKLGYLPLFVALLFAIRMYKIKRPCKSTLNRVQ